MLAALLLLLLVSAMAVAVAYMSATETRLGGTDRENTLAYYGAEAAMEQMMSDLSGLYTRMQAPTQSDIDALEAIKPSLPGVQYSEYDLGQMGAPESRTIKSGPHAGLLGIITPLTLKVAARMPGGAEVKMTRDVEIALIPIFQFNRFSDSDLAYEGCADLDTYGRVHTNGNLFLSSCGTYAAFRNKVTAAKEMIRSRKSDGTAAGTGKVYVTTTASGCTNLTTNCREWKTTEDSATGWPLPGTPNPNWPTVSTGLPPSGYNGNLLNGATGARRLDLPAMEPGSGLLPIEIIRRPRSGESTNSAAGQSRLYNKAQIRVLLSDTVAELPGGSGDAENVRLWNATGTAYPTGVTVTGAAGNPTYFASGRRSTDSDWIKLPSSLLDSDYYPLLDGNVTNSPFTEGGWLRVEVRKTDGTYQGVTREWLQYGFARGLAIPNSEVPVSNNVHPNAILILQLLADRDANGNTTGTNETSAPWGASHRDKFYPINLYDPYEGEYNDTYKGSGTTTCGVAGIINVVEIDVLNLRKWLLGQAPYNTGTGTQVEDQTQNGFLLYFSDRRGMLPNANGEIIGEFGYEDTDPPIPGASLTIEDVNANNIVDTYGENNLGTGFGVANSAYTRVSCVTRARKNRVTGARHAVRLVNGTRGNLPSKRPGTTPYQGGFSLASENAAYVHGNYNASVNNNTNWSLDHVAAAIISDTKTMLLSKDWTDLKSFQNPVYPQGKTMTGNNWYRVALLGGSATRPGGSQIGYLEDWNGRTQYWRGSMVNLYFAQYHTGNYAGGGTTYRAPAVRDWTFDDDFLDPAKLPPGTPMLRDVVNLGFQQTFRAD